MRDKLPRTLLEWVWAIICLLGAVWLGFTYWVLLYAKGFTSPIMLVIVMGYFLWGGLWLATAGRPDFV